MGNNDEKKTFMIRKATEEELLEWGLAFQRDYRENQKIINADGLIVLPHPEPVDIEETEWIDSNEHDPIKWRR